MTCLQLLVFFGPCLWLARYLRMKSGRLEYLYRVRSQKRKHSWLILTKTRYLRDIWKSARHKHGSFVNFIVRLPRIIMNIAVKVENYLIWLLMISLCRTGSLIKKNHKSWTKSGLWSSRGQKMTSSVWRLENKWPASWLLWITWL